jgi:hypothetical protein
LPEALAVTDDQIDYIRTLRGELKGLGRKMEQGDESELLIWVIPEKLACAHRPLRHNRLYGGSLRNLAEAATGLLFDWASRVREYGIKSIISLMSSEELALYSRLKLGAEDLLAFYRSQGFEVASIPWKDPAHVRRDPKALLAKERQVSVEALRYFDSLPKPVLLHCSAGIDRSSPVAAYIRSQRGPPTL